MTSTEIAETLIREICYLGNSDVYRDATKDRFVEVISKAILEERRACKEIANSSATMANGMGDSHGWRVATSIAQAIGARGKKP